LPLATSLVLALLLLLVGIGNLGVQLGRAPDQLKARAAANSTAGAASATGAEAATATASAAAATAALPTATALVRMPATYMTARPGSVCGAPGDWFRYNSQTTCLREGVQVTAGSDTTLFAELWFQGAPGLTFTPNERVRVTLSSLTPQTCGGVILYRGGDFSAFGFFVCTDGTWLLDKFDRAGSGQRLANGKVSAPPTPSVITVTIIGSRLFTTVNQTNLGVFDAAAYPQASRVSLGVFSARASDSGILAGMAAEFRDFAYTAFP
jgi:hypothetical protein